MNHCRLPHRQPYTGNMMDGEPIHRSSSGDVVRHEACSQSQAPSRTPLSQALDAWAERQRRESLQTHDGRPFRWATAASAPLDAHPSGPWTLRQRASDSLAADARAVGQRAAHSGIVNRAEVVSQATGLRASDPRGTRSSIADQNPRFTNSRSVTSQTDPTTADKRAAVWSSVNPTALGLRAVAPAAMDRWPTELGDARSQPGQALAGDAASRAIPPPWVLRRSTEDSHATNLKRTHHAEGHHGMQQATNRLHGTMRFSSSLGVGRMEVHNPRSSSLLTEALGPSTRSVLQDSGTCRTFNTCDKFRPVFKRGESLRCLYPQKSSDQRPRRLSSFEETDNATGLYDESINTSSPFSHCGIPAYSRSLPTSLDAFVSSDSTNNITGDEDKSNISHHEALNSLQLKRQLAPQERTMRKRKKGDKINFGVSTWEKEWAKKLGNKFRSKKGNTSKFKVENKDTSEDEVKEMNKLILKMESRDKESNHNKESSKLRKGCKCATDEKLKTMGVNASMISKSRSDERAEYEAKSEEKAKAKLKVKKESLARAIARMRGNLSARALAEAKTKAKCKSEAKIAAGMKVRSMTKVKRDLWSKIEEELKSKTKTKVNAEQRAKTIAEAMDKVMSAAMERLVLEAKARVQKEVEVKAKAMMEEAQRAMAEANVKTEDEAMDGYRRLAKTPSNEFGFDTTQTTTFLREQMKPLFNRTDGSEMPLKHHADEIGLRSSDPSTSVTTRSVAKSKVVAEALAHAAMKAVLKVKLEAENVALGTAMERSDSKERDLMNGREKSSQHKQMSMNTIPAQNLGVKSIHIDTFELNDGSENLPLQTKSDKQHEYPKDEMLICNKTKWNGTLESQVS